MLDRLLFDEVHHKHDLECDRVFLDVAGGDISNQERGKILFINGHFPSIADSSGISLEVFIQYADACTPPSNIPSWCGLPPHPAQPPDCYCHRRS